MSRRFPLRLWITTMAASIALTTVLSIPTPSSAAPSPTYGAAVLDRR